MKLSRHPHNPVLLPDPASDWECYNVFNPGVVYDGGLFHMLYRAQGLDWVSRLGYAVSRDGLHWNRLRRPVLEPSGPDESRGVEDPRLVRIDGVFYLTYTAYSAQPGGQRPPAHAAGSILPMIARSENLIHWDRLAPIVRGEDNKDHVLFPRRVGGRFAALHRRWPNVWLAYSDDLLSWPAEAMAPIFGPRPDNGWDGASVGSNGVPIETDHGWLLMYHAYDAGHVYRFGACLLDRDDPSRVVRRPQAPIFWPEELWELRGDVPNVVFSGANPVVDGVVYIFYGGGDHVIGLATCRLDDLVDYCLHD